MTTDIVWPRSLSGNHLRRTLPHIAKPIDATLMKTLAKTSVVTLREITKSTVRTVSLLDVAPGQEGLVAPNAFSIAQAHFHPEAWFRAIYADETPIGFAMLEDWSQAPQHEQPDKPATESCCCRGRIRRTQTGSVAKCFTVNYDERRATSLIYQETLARRLHEVSRRSIGVVDHG